MFFSCLLTKKRKKVYHKLHLAYFARKLRLLLVPYLFICLFIYAFDIIYTDVNNIIYLFILLVFII